MIQLFLTSAFADSYEQLKPFVDDSLENKTIAFFDTASQVEEYSEFKDEALALLEK